MLEPPDAPLVVAAFLARYFADHEAGTVRSLADYEALFPGFAEVAAARASSTWPMTRSSADRSR